MVTLLESRGLSLAYTDLAVPVKVLKDLDFELSENESIGIFGASGAGKSTLLHILGGLDRPESGVVKFEGEDIFSWSDNQRAKFRNEELGFIFQFYHLLSEFTAKENVMLPMLIGGIARNEAANRAETVLNDVGLKERLHHRPYMLSGGEQQRVALARAVVMKPKVLLADEPTGNLDRKNGEIVFNYLKEIKQKNNMAMVVVSHNAKLIDSLPKKYELVDGRLNEA